MIDTGKISVSYKFPFFFSGKKHLCTNDYWLTCERLSAKIGFQICGFFLKDKNTDICLNDFIYPILSRNKLLYRNKN